MNIEEIERLERKIYGISNSFLPLDKFFNDIRDNYYNENYDKKEAYKDIEIIADFIIKLNHQNQVVSKALELACDQIWAMSVWENSKEEVIKDNINFFTKRANEYLQIKKEQKRCDNEN